MTAIAKSAKTHPEAKKCVWEEPAIHFFFIRTFVITEARGVLYF